MFSSLKEAAMKACQNGQLTEHEAQTYLRSGNVLLSYHCGMDRSPTRNVALTELLVGYLSGIGS